jgi:putative hydrolase of the HAD superfamily
MAGTPKCSMPAPFLFFDLDDTIIRFSAGQPDFWVLALAAEADLGVDGALLRRAIDPVSDEYWGDPASAFRGRMNMHDARREIALRALGAHGVPASVCLRIADRVTDEKEEAVRPFDGAIEALSVLRERGHRLALLTNGSAQFQRRKIERFALAQHFETVLIEGELGFGKPDPRVFQRALAHFGSRAEDAWMIGDNLHADIQPAQALGLRGIWHDAYAAGLPSDRPCVPDQVIGSIAELCAAV